MITRLSRELLIVVVVVELAIVVVESAAIASKIRRVCSIFSFRSTLLSRKGCSCDALVVLFMVLVNERQETQREQKQE